MTNAAGALAGSSLCCVRCSVHAEEESHLDWNTQVPHRLEWATANVSLPLPVLFFSWMCLPVAYLNKLGWAGIWETHICLYLLVLGSLPRSLSSRMPRPLGASFMLLRATCGFNPAVWCGGAAVSSAGILSLAHGCRLGLPYLTSLTCNDVECWPSSWRRWVSASLLYVISDTMPSEPCLFCAHHRADDLLFHDLLV